MLGSLFNRIHIATGSGQFSDLYTEVSNNYTSGYLNTIQANKYVDEIYRRKRSSWHNFTKDLSYFPVVNSSPTNMYFIGTVSANWNDINNWFLDSLGTSPAGRIPINNDDITILGDVNTPPILNVSPNSFTIGTQGDLINTYSFTCSENVDCDISVYGQCIILGSLSSSFTVTAYDNSIVHNLSANSVILMNGASITGSLNNITTLYLYGNSTFSGGGTFTTVYFDELSILNGSGFNISLAYAAGSSIIGGNGTINDLRLSAHSAADSSQLTVGSVIASNFANLANCVQPVLYGTFYDNSYRSCVEITHLTYTSVVPDRIYGCMDPLALNYNPSANCSDGSCSYIT